MLSYPTKADLAEPEQQERETLTCEQCGVKVGGERGFKIHLQQWCGQSAREVQATSRLEAKNGAQGPERVKKWPCSYCKKRILHSIEIALPTSAQHAATSHHRCLFPEISRHKRRHHQYQSPSSTIPRFQFYSQHQHQHPQMILYPQPALARER